MLPAVAANLLKNSDFSDLTGAKLPRGWEFRGKALPEVTDKGCLTLGGNASGMMAIQYNLPVKPGTRYTMRWFAAGKAPYKCYIEYSYSDNGKKKIGGTHYNLIEPVEQGSTVSFQFAVPSKATQTYVVFSVKSAEKVTVSKLILQESAEAEREEGLLKNCDFSILDRKQLPVGWDCRGKAENYRFANGKAEVKGHKNFLTASLKNAIGKDVVFECQVAGKGKYKIYAEWYWTADGKRRSRSTQGKWLEAVPEGKKFSLPFRIPNGIKTAILAIQLDSDTFISFSRLSLKEGNSKSFSLSPTAVKNFPLTNLIPGKKYQVSYTVKGTGSTGNTTTFHFFALSLVNRFGDLKAGFPAEDCLMDVMQQKTVTFTMPALSAKEGKDIFLKFRSQSAGKLEIRILAVKPAKDLAPQERLVITSPRFRSTFYSSIQENKVEGHIASGEAVTGGEAVLKTAAGKRHAAALKRTGKVWQFTLPGEAGELEVSLKLKDGKEKKLKETIRRLPAAPVEVITGPGRRLHINGRPFIQIEVSRVGLSRSEHVFYGGNTIRRHAPSTPEDCLKILDQDKENNHKTLLSFMKTPPRVADENKLRQWEHWAENILTKEVLSHPALLGYFLDDEPYWNGVSLKSLRKCYDVLRKLDPYRPVWICSAPRGTIEEQRRYADCCDIFGVDIYPVPVPNSHSHLEDKTLSCVGKYVRRMAEITDGNRPVAIWLQAFAWGDLSKNKNKIYPTWTESRFMLYDAVINGADAFFWWGLWYAADTGFHDDLMKVTRELQTMTGVLASENHVPGKVSNPAVEYRRYHGKDWSCVIAANTQNKKLDVRFTGIPGVAENDQTFGPYEVKIFSTGKLPPSLDPLPEVDLTKLKFRKALVAKRDSSQYDPPAGMKWIWGEKEQKIPKSKIFARVKLSVNAGLKKAYLRFTADDYAAAVFLDGKKLIVDTGKLMSNFRYLNNLEIEPVLKPGEHIVCIEAGDAGQLPCGLLAEIRLEYADGKIVSIPTNSAWETAPEANGPWTRAAEIKKIGDHPWRMPNLLKSVVANVK